MISISEGRPLKQFEKSKLEVELPARERCQHFIPSGLLLCSPQGFTLLEGCGCSQ